jgi:hypothetical protein
MSDQCRKTVTQCKTCPWRVGADVNAIPNYRPAMHAKLDKTIASGPESLFRGAQHAMACHYSKTGEEFPCAGWLHNQLGPGNNIGVRMGVMTGRYPVPEVDGEQHETFEDTLPRKTGRRRRAR